MVDTPQPNSADTGPQGFLSIQDAVDLQLRQTREPEENPQAPDTPSNGAGETDTGSDTGQEASGQPEPASPETEYPEQAVHAPVDDPYAYDDEAEDEDTGYDEETEDATDEHPREAPLSPEDVLFEHDGEGITLSEAQKSYLRFSDYTRKTQEAAALKKEAEATLQKAEQDRQQYAANLAQLQKGYESLIALDSNVDWETLETTDPVGYLQARERQREQRDNLAALQQEQQRIEQEAFEAQQQQLQAFVAQENKAIQERFPQWKDPQKAQEDRARVQTYLQGVGLSNDEISHIVDHRFVQICMDAVAGHELKSKKPLAQRKVAKAKPMLRGSGRTRQPPASSKRLKRAEKRLTEEGSLEAAVDLHMAKQRAAQQ